MLLARPPDVTSCDSDGFRDAARDMELSGSQNSPSLSGDDVYDIRDVMNRGKHALRDVTPNAVDKLNSAQFYPIVILAKADSKQTIKH